MREIKYRAHIKQLGIVFPVVNIDLDLILPEVTIDPGESQIERVDYRFDEIDLMQYTGLRDKNSREIYEGYILYHKVQGKRKVYYPFDDRTASYGLENVDNGMRGTLGNPLLYEVIGNIYEHSHLLDDAP